MKNVIKSLAKSVLIPLKLTTTGSAADTGIHKKILGSERCSSDLAQQTALINSNEEMEDIAKIVRSLEEPCLLIIGVSKTVKNEAKEQKCGFLSILLNTLGNSLLGNQLTGKGMKAKIRQPWVIRASKGTIRFLMPAHPLTNLEIQKTFSE